MADIVNLGDKLKAQREATARLDLTAKMIPIMVETVEKFAAIGAKPNHIVGTGRNRPLADSNQATALAGVCNKKPAG
jgi:hypothetical protein